MNVFQDMLSRRKTKSINSDHMPIINDFVDVAMGDKTETVCFESVSKTSFETRSPKNAVVGLSALFNYGNHVGRFRFRTLCTKTDGKYATFALPTEITVIERLNEKRRSFRLKMLMNVQWRYAPDGVGYGPYVRSNTHDLSSNGARLDVGRELRSGTQVEILFEQILVEGKPLAVLGVLTRPAQREEKLLIAGVRFTSLSQTAQNAVSEYIRKLQKSDKKRHLAR
jgi:hypothetical protein